MDPVSIFPAIFALAIALGTIKIINRFSKVHPVPLRYGSIEGLRGYLAFFVFLHHSSIWYFYLRTNEWNGPTSNLYIHFGGSSVALFFMITGFLFFSKLIDAKSKPIDWLQLYLSRVMRLLPLYLFAIMLLIVIVSILSHFSINESSRAVLKEIMEWSTFTINGLPNINGIRNTSIIMAKVPWTLVYEWLFYFSLPLFGLIFFRSRPSFLTLIITIIGIVWIVHFSTLWLTYIYPFLGGIIASFLARSERFSSWASQTISSVIVLVCLICLVLFFSTSFSIISLMLLSIVFIVIACGNTIFGLLSNRVSGTFGKMGYSIYLLHGMVLFVTFKFIIGFENAAMLSPTEHWLVIFCSTVPLILICYLTYMYIELPGMNARAKIFTIARKYYLVLAGSLHFKNKS